MTARPPTLGYTAAKFVRRNRLGVSVLATALVALVALPSRRRVSAAQAERPGDALALAH